LTALWEGLAFPKAVRQMSREVLRALCQALKQHMAKAFAGQAALPQALSAVELTLALHRVFRVPYEFIVFEREALALAHKLLLGQVPGFVSQALPPVKDGGEASCGPWALAHAMALLKARKQSGHGGKGVVVLDERRPLHKESFEVFSRVEAADMPWVLVLARVEEGGEVFLEEAALGEFFGSLNVGVWHMGEGAPLEEIEEVLRGARGAKKTTLMHIKLT